MEKEIKTPGKNWDKKSKPSQEWKSANEQMMADSKKNK